MATRVSRTIDALFVLAALTSCSHATQALAPRNVAEVSPATASVSAKLVTDRDSPALRLEPGEEYVPPQLIRNATPSYPSQLMPLHLAPHVVTLRVTFNEDKSVAAVDVSPAGETTRDDYEAAFEAAARDAVKSWKCWPAAIRRFHQGPDYRIMDSECLLKSFFDVAFTFEVVNGQPVVRSAK